MITEDDVRHGRVHSLLEPELCAIARRSRSWAQKRRGKELPPEYETDSSGRIFYPAAAVIAYLDSRVKHKCTAEYDNTKKQQNLEKARAAKVEKQLQKTRGLSRKTSI